MIRIEPIPAPYALSADEVVERLRVDPSRGLDSADAGERLGASPTPTPWAYWRAMARQGIPRAMIGVTLGIGLTDHADHGTTSIDHRQPTDVEFGERLGDIGEQGLGLGWHSALFREPNGSVASCSAAVASLRRRCP